MISSKYNKQIEHAQYILNAICSSPEKDLKKLSTIISKLKPSNNSIKLQRLVLEIDDLIAQMRWHFGQAILINQIYPEKFEKNNHEKDDYPPKILLELRQFFGDNNKIIFQDYNQGWRGGSVAGWIYHMMIDNAITRSISILDRLTRVLNIFFNVGLKRVYFRSGKLEKIYNKKNDDNINKLINLSKEEIYEKLLLKYRDKLHHSRKEFSQISGMLPTEIRYNFLNDIEIVESIEWDDENLYALTNASYHYVTEVLKIVTRIIEDNNKYQTTC